jgi:hypothetical protein
MDAILRLPKIVFGKMAKNWLYSIKIEGISWRYYYETYETTYLLILIHFRFMGIKKRFYSSKLYE